MTPIAYNETEARQDPAVRLSAAFIAAASEVLPLVIRKYPKWRDIPRVMTSSEAEHNRLAALSAGTKTGVDFKRVLAKFAKGRLAEFELSFASDLFRCTRPVEDKLVIAVEWHHQSGIGIGKMLELSVGSRWDDKAAVMRWQIPMFFGFAQAARWAYNTKEDLEACLHAGTDFVDVLVPPLSAALARNMAMAEIPGGAGAATAHEALDIAKREIARFSAFPGLGSVDDADLRFAGAEVRHTTGHWGPLIAADGRIRAHAEWWMRFVAESGEGVSVAVPYMGRPLVLQFTKGISRVEPLGEIFVDSGEALHTIADNSLFPENAVFTALTLGYQRPYMSGACWRVDFTVPNTSSRGVAWVDSANGHIVFYGS